MSFSFSSFFALCARTTLTRVFFTHGLRLESLEVCSAGGGGGGSGLPAPFGAPVCFFSAMSGSPFWNSVLRVMRTLNQRRAGHHQRAPGSQRHAAPLPCKLCISRHRRFR